MFQPEVAEDSLQPDLVITSAIKVHKALGPGLLESAYRTCLSHELQKQGMRVDAEVEIPIIYDNLQLAAGYRADLIVNEELLIELKAVKSVEPIHKSQLLTYLRLANLPRGLLINFNVGLLRDGVHRVANSYAR